MKSSSGRRHEEAQQASVCLQYSPYLLTARRGQHFHFLFAQGRRGDGGGDRVSRFGLGWGRMGEVCVSVGVSASYTWCHLLGPVGLFVFQSKQQIAAFLFLRSFFFLPYATACVSERGMYINVVDQRSTRSHLPGEFLRKMTTCWLIHGDGNAACLRARSDPVEAGHTRRGGSSRGPGGLGCTFFVGGMCFQ